MSGIEVVIEAVGGTGAAAALLGVAPSTVSSWRARGSIPVEHWFVLVSEASRLGRVDVTFELLARLHARRTAASTALEARP